MIWNDPAAPPAMRGPGIPSLPVIALLDNGEQCPAEFWQSTAEGQPPKWYMSKDVLGYDCPYIEICNTVVGWVPVLIFGNVGNLVYAEMEAK
jgi:hypothetical protein